ncbi:hypothetical protein [Microscilla marina]|uniref:Lipoprotein n=1 Tax=Microscilla marina ATCC 23134 TaxID=313606 RepID=A1ZUI8_MICM2|nr:hypothetical protein [Microscilla marina]EAY26007.1 hypothetical protein M23134_07156 [Microscilla marina ATCC 23134]
MKKTTLVVWVCLLWANTTVAQSLPKGQAIKQQVIQFFGGKKALKKVRKLSYTLEMGVPGQARLKEQVWVHFKRKRLRKTFTRKGKKVTQYYKKGKAWEGRGKHKRFLAKDETDKLGNVFFYNFLGMLNNPQVQWQWLKETTYQNQKVAIVKAADATHSLDLFVTASGKILTTGMPNPQSGEYEVLADELEYVNIGKGIKFPLVFKVYSNGVLVYIGRFKNVKV